jgi:hypothetical protein
VTPSTRFRVRKPHVIHQTIDGEVVIINLNTGSYYSLLDAGAQIWEAIAQHASEKEVVDLLSSRYDADEGSITDATAALIDRLREEDLIAPLDEEPAIQLDESRITAADGRAFEAPTLEKYDDMQDLILLDPVHEIDEEEGWPKAKAAGGPAPA